MNWINTCNYSHQVLFQFGDGDVFEGAVARVRDPLEAVPHVDVRPRPLLHLRARRPVDLVQRPAVEGK